MAIPRTVDLWSVAANKVFAGVPFDVAVDWLGVARVGPDDKVRVSENSPWVRLADSEWFAPYLLAPIGDEFVQEDPSLIELELPSPRVREAEDDDVDMIPLIDISMVLLIFFMMTSVAAAISRVAVPETENAEVVSADKNLIRFDVDRDADGQPLFAVAIGTENPTPENDHLRGVAEAMERFDEKLKTLNGPASVRIAAHGDLMFEDVEKLIREIDQRRNNGIDIRGTTVEVAGRGRP